LLLGYALVPDVTLIQVADLGGVYLLSFVLAFVNASVAEAMRCARREPRRLPGTLAPAGVLLVLVYAYGMSRIAAPLPQTPAVRIAVVQGNNDLGMQWRPEFYGRGLEQYLRLSMQAAQRTHPRLIVWPESAVTFFLAHEPHYQALIARTLTAIGADLIVGAPHYEDADPARPAFFNSVFYMTADGQLRGRYDKARLLPFAEYFPLRTIEFLRRDFERVRYFTAGDGTTLLHTRIGTAAVVVCFEAIFPELVRRQMARGADVLLNVSNDVWLGRNAGPAQHLTMASLRAVENRTWLIRATTTGVSAIIDPLGRVRERSSTFAAAVLDGYIVPMQVDTVYKRYGDVFAYASVAAAIVALLWVAWCGNREADRVAAKGERSKQER
jgi:apolipoprotein N-acyltransferase